VYIANNSRTQRSSVPKFGRNVPHLRCDSLTSFKVKSSKVKVTRRINADTHRAPYLPNAKVYELQTWYTDGRRRPASAVGAMTSKGRGQGYKITWSVWAVLAQWLINWKRTVVVSPITKIGRMVPHDTCYIAQQFQCQKIKGQGHRPTNADTQNVSSSKRYGLEELQSWYADGGRRPASAASAMTSNFKGQGHKVTWAGAYRVGRTRWPHLLFQLDCTISASS